MFHAPWSRKEVRLMFDRLSSWLMDNELMKSMINFIEIIGSLISMFGYIIITAIALLMGYLTFKVIKLMFKITIFISLVIGILSNITIYAIKLVKIVKDMTTPKKQ
jgi:hypothetical protein